MHSSHLLLEEPIRMASILKPSKSVSNPLIHIQFLSGSFGNKIQLKVPCLHGAYSDSRGLLEARKEQYEEEQESASATKKLHQKRQFITI
ncbi:hypothetical protein IGI04_006671 [Brassica rapa subsp. trilocularis]|uniref:Uncharacterized protein n=1 Tax=Brassica rapa subsp. trilocularis TaxID=1813537 RepID=A0ABQ7NHI8_BRACM|nr:hypothetical protein IGI04_006671 [Brassica rapa subsp. trilocularis]